MVGVPEQDWVKIREDFLREQKDQDDQQEGEEDPLIAEARKLVGNELIEIKD
jgi:DNA polymerase-3 subunit gamma/tau